MSEMTQSETPRYCCYHTDRQSKDATAKYCMCCQIEKREQLERELRQAQQSQLAAEMDASCNASCADAWRSVAAELRLIDNKLFSRPGPESGLERAIALIQQLRARLEQATRLLSECKTCLNYVLYARFPMGDKVCDHIPQEWYQRSHEVIEAAAASLAAKEGDR